MKRMVTLCILSFSCVCLGQTSASLDNSYVYELPFKSGKIQLVTQGYMGKYSHSGEHALDFRLHKGQSICAARGGVVTEVFEESYRTFYNRKHSYKANFVVIKHDDGSFSKYMHIDFKGVLVELGDNISSGQVIAKAGNTGNSTMAHLHLVCYTINEEGKKITFPTLFETKKGPKELKAWHFYRKPEAD
jgi:murein DD-endopeptidase MepM/ murein hydrolase activator NlpD